MKVEASLENAHELRSFGRVNLPDLETWGVRLLRESPAILTLTSEWGSAEWPRLHDLALREGPVGRSEPTLTDPAETPAAALGSTAISGS